ncbi:hypothetical protein CHH27_13320 [Labrenzia sp. VG12]|nr:hypothetical protein CHH27_13320 [Labrenzia sp. VG12]
MRPQETQMVCEHSIPCTFPAKRQWLRRAFGASLCAAGLLLSDAGMADYVGGLNPNGDNFLAMRRGPGTGHPMMLEMGPGTIVTVLKRQGNWALVALEDGTSGWAYGKYIKPGLPSSTDTGADSNIVYVAGSSDPEDLCFVIVEQGQFGRIEGCVSSVLPRQGRNYYGAGSAFDGDTHSAWVEGRPHEGTGEWIEYLFEDAMVVQTIEIISGYAKNNKTFLDNARPARVTIHADDVPVGSVRLADTPAPQIIRLPEPVSAQFLRLEITDVYPGRKYKDLAITELWVDLEEHHMTFEPEVSAPQEPVAPPQPTPVIAPTPQAALPAASAPPPCHPKHWIQAKSC